MKKPFKLKYKNSAFPFKESPTKRLETRSGEEVIEVDEEGKDVEENNIETAKGKWRKMHRGTGEIANVSSILATDSAKWGW